MAPVIEPVQAKAAWEAQALRDDPSWVVELNATHQAELGSALDCFKQSAQERGLTAQWLHGHMMPCATDFPLPTLGPVLRQLRLDLEQGVGLALLKGFPVAGVAPKDLQLMHAGLASHVGELRPQTVFGELVQDIRDAGQAALKERRGSKHNRALPFHNDPCDVVAFLCVEPALSGGRSLFASSLAIHNALLRAAPQHVETLYQDFVHAYQDYLFVRTGSNQRFLPESRSYPMPIFTVAKAAFACKYSRFYIDEAQQFPEVARLTPRQQAALEALEGELREERWQLGLDYQPGDVMFVNNYVCFHARTAFTDAERDEAGRRHLLRIWLSMPNSRPLSRHWARQVFFRSTEPGAIRGGVPTPDVSYA
jgi:hypothetical protein